MDELLHLLATQGPAGLIAITFAVLWWTERRSREELQQDYYEHLADDISDAREVKA